MQRGMKVIATMFLVAGCSDASVTSEQEVVKESVAGEELIAEATYEYPAKKVPDEITAKHEMKHPIVAYFRGVDEEFIYIDVTEALWHHLQSLTPHTEVHFESMTVDGVISKENLILIGANGQQVTEEQLFQDDYLYLDYDMSQFNSIADDEIESDLIIVDLVTAEEIIEEYYPSSPNEYHVAMIYIEGSGQVIDPEWDKMDILLLDYPNIHGFHGIRQEDNAPDRRDLQAELELDSLPQFVVFGHQGPLYATDNLEELLAYLDKLE
ncbi:hypothetical protein [Alkalihalophilus marmarensis]|uniref:hypothetical protein n=1 Tax=Alkalihalophilus marmarensis TaxID=521377 RepID=UPI002DB9A97A|nr:hypothetical protein [Alkalihalophilus marmarensis]MEC2071348.1 hypothetical protein [Alkalihalophilus marmarensis]